MVRYSLRTISGIISSMQPSGQSPTPTPPQNRYDYILNPPQAPRRKIPLFGGGNKVVNVIFVSVVLILALIVYSVFSSATKANYDSVVRLAERQQEIIRVSNLGLIGSQDPATLIYVSTVASTTQSEQNATLAFLTKKGVKVSSVELALKKDSTTDSALTTAQQNNTYDAVLINSLKGLLTSYQKAEKDVILANSNSEKVLFTTLLSNAKTLDGSN